MTDVRSKLAAEIEEVPFGPLVPHAKRLGLFLVSAELDLLDAAVAVAGNRTAVLEHWIGSGLLRRPSAEELAAFAASPEGFRFRVAIIQPWVLAQAVDA
ncbi:MAG: DUF2288 family protein [Polyangiales bacterium]